MTRFWALSAGGFAATAISFGPARMGFGLFVPEFRTAFDMSSAEIGLISGLGFLGFFIGLLLAQPLLARRGPELPVVTGLVAATAGLLTVALAPTVPVLAAGVVLATASAGFAWTPFNDAVHRTVPDWWRPAALSTISTGTSVGVAGAGLSALAMVGLGMPWRACWALFAVASALALWVNLRALRDLDRAPEPAPRAWRGLLRPVAAPLFGIGFVYGTTSAIYVSFAADRAVAAGGLPGVPVDAVPGLVFVCYGLCGFAGLATGGLKARLGLPTLLRALMLAGAGSLALVALAPGHWAGLIPSAGLQGAHVMMTSAVLAFWSERLYPGLPSLSFTAALLAMAAGSILGPAVAGVVSQTADARTMFLAAAALPALLAAGLRDRHARDRPVPAGPIGQGA